MNRLPSESDSTGPEPLVHQDRELVQSGTATGRRELSGRLSGLTLPRQVSMLAMWPFFEQVLNFLVGFVDTAIAGHLNVEATKAIAVAAYVGWLMGLLQAAVGVGSTAVIARAIGGRHKRVANAALGQSLVLGAIAGSCMGAFVYSIAPVVAGFMELSGDSLAYCVQYLRIVSLAAPCSAVLFVGAACLRGAGDTRSPFWVMIVVNAVNTSMSLLLVYGPAPLGGHAVKGIAGGTALAWMVGMVSIVVVLLRGRKPIRLNVARLRPHWHMMQRIIRVGLPTLGESAGMWIGNFLVLKVVGLVGTRYEPAALGAHMIAVRVEAISYLPTFALGVAAATLTGQYLGLGDPHRARRAATLAWGIGAAIMGTLGILFLLVPQYLVRTVTNEPELLRLAPPLLRICGPVQVFFATYIVLSQAMRGAGDTMATMFMTYFCTYLVRLPLAYLLALPLGLGLRGVWFGLCAELTFRGLIFWGRFRHGGWARAKV